MGDVELIRLRREEILAIARRYGARNVRLFGSVALWRVARRTRVVTSISWWSWNRGAAFLIWAACYTIYKSCLG